MFILASFLNYFGFYTLYTLLNGNNAYTSKENKILSRNIFCFFFGAFCIFYAALGDSNTLQQIILAYFGTDTIIMMYNPVFQQNSYYVHHAMTCMLVLYNMHHPNTDYYLFHLGAYGELSTLPLCLADSFKNIPKLREEYPVVNHYSRISFAVLFFIVRVGWWTYIIYHCDETLYIRGVLYSLMILQYVWAKKLVQAMLKLL